MKKILKIGGIIFISLIGLIGIVALFIGIADVPTYKVEPIDLKVEVTANRIIRGSNIASTLCNHCHMSDNNLLEGKLFAKAEEGLGELYAPNITQHSVYGIGSWTDGELFYLLRTGIKKDGTHAFPAMVRSNQISDEDLYSIIAYLRSDRPEVQPSEKVHPPYKPSFIAKALFRFVLKPLSFINTPVTTPPIEDTKAYGRYLVNGPMVCYECHSADFMTNNAEQPELSVGYLGGGSVFVENGDTIISPNITGDPENGIGNWTEQEFIQTVKWGKRPNGEPVKYPMLPYTYLDTTEVLAIFEYLKSVP